jgi:hypothetical protein
VLAANPVGSFEAGVPDHRPRCKIVAKTKKGDPEGSPFLLYNQVFDWLRR